MTPKGSLSTIRHSNLTIKHWAKLQGIILEHGPISIEGIAKIAGKKNYEIKASLFSMMLAELPIHKDSGGLYSVNSNLQGS